MRYAFTPWRAQFGCLGPGPWKFWAFPSEIRLDLRVDSNALSPIFAKLGRKTGQNLWNGIRSFLFGFLLRSMKPSSLGLELTLKPNGDSASKKAFRRGWPKLWRICQCFSGCLFARHRQSARAWFWSQHWLCPVKPFGEWKKALTQCCLVLLFRFRASCATHLFLSFQHWVGVFFHSSGKKKTPFETSLYNAPLELPFNPPLEIPLGSSLSSIPPLAGTNFVLRIREHFWKLCWIELPHSAPSAVPEVLGRFFQIPKKQKLNCWMKTAGFVGPGKSTWK